MKWVVIAIVVALAGYTFVRLHYQKPNRAYRPYEDTKKRVNTARLLAAGYQRVELLAQRLTEATVVQNSGFPAPGGLPGELKSTIVSLPLLPAEIMDARGAATATSNAPYEIEFRCTVPDDHRQLTGAELYLRGDEVVITPDFEMLAPGLLSRSRDTFAQLTVPAGTLKPGSYRVTLVGERVSRAWTLQVK